MKFFVNFTNPSETVMLFVSSDSSYFLSSHCPFFQFYLFSGMVTWEDYISTARGEWLEGFKNSGGGNNMHSVLKGLVLRPICIPGPNLAKWVEISSSNFSKSLLLSNKNDPSSTYFVQNHLKRFLKLEDFGLWLITWLVERREFLCLDNVAFGSPFFVNYFSIVLENSMMINMKRTRDILSPCLTPTSMSTKVSIFPIISLTKMFSYIHLIV